MKNVLLIDYGGVLSTPPLDALAAYDRAHGYPPGTMERAVLGTPSDWSGDHSPWQLLELGKLTFEDFVEIVAESAEQAGVGRFDRAAYRAFELTAPVTAQAPVLNVVRDLASRSVRCGIVTNNVREFSPIWRATVPMELFEVVVESWQQGVRKPAPDLWLVAADKLGVDARAVVAVDDQQPNLDALSPLGMATVLAGGDVAMTAQAISDAFGASLRRRTLPTEPVRPTARARLDPARVRGCLRGVAAGDVIGKQGDDAPPDVLAQWHPGGINGFEQEPGLKIPRFAHRTYKWRTGEWTDDTEQTVAVARAVIAAGTVDHRAIATELMTCVKSVHPPCSISRLVDSGDIGRVAYAGNGLGAAMRVSPAAIATAPQGLRAVAAAAFESAVPTHGGRQGICGAAAVAGAVATAVLGGTGEEIIEASMAAADEATRFRAPDGTPDLASKIACTAEELRHEDLKRLDPTRSSINPYELVPLAIVLAAYLGDARAAILAAANLGGDADSLAAIAGAVAGAMAPETVPEEWHRVITDINEVDVDRYVDPLVRLAETL